MGNRKFVGLYRSNTVGMQCDERRHGDASQTNHVIRSHQTRARLECRASACLCPRPASSWSASNAMHILELILEGFKSYPVRTQITGWDPSFNAINGLNGSGKSNTIDALLFVFGYRASKMRQGKLSELIHNSANYPDLEDCSVEVHFREIVDLVRNGPNSLS